MLLWEIRQNSFMIFTQAWITRITRLLFHWNNRKIRVICA